jgi:hypothetical protein
MPRAKRLTTAEAAARVGISESQMRVIAHRDGIGRKEGGAWSFTEHEVKKLIELRKTDAEALKARQRWERERRKLKGLPPKRKKPKQRAPARDPYDEERPR